MIISQKIYLLASGVVICSVILFLLFKVKSFIEVLGTVADDTLKRHGKDGKLIWSATRLTMFIAFLVVIWSYIYDMINHGFNETAFMVMVGIALGAKVTDAWSKKIDPTITPPKDEQAAL